MTRSFLSAFGNRLAYLSSVADSGKPVATFRFLRDRYYIVSDPALARLVLATHSDSLDKGIGLVHAMDALGNGQLTSSGAQWERQRRATRSMLSEKHVGASAEAAFALASDLADRWQQRADPRTPIDLALGMQVLMLRLFCSSTCEVDVPTSQLIGLARAMSTINEDTGRRMAPPTSLLAPIARGSASRRAKAVRLFRAFVESDLIGHPRLHNDDERPVAQMLRALGSAASRDEKNDQVATLLFAATETTAAALFWAFYLLAQHHPLSDQVAEEATICAGADASGLQQLPFTTNLTSEALRMYPPVWAIPRRTNRPIRLGPQDLPLGAHVLVSPYTIHHDASFWPNPSECRPSRFSTSSPPGAYLPFGVGPRHCPGQHLARTQMLAIVTCLAGRFRFRYADPCPATPRAALTLRPPKRGRFILTPR